LGIPAFLLASTLRKQGILVRYYSNTRLMHYVRFSIGRPEETAALVRALDSIHEDISKPSKEYIKDVEAVLWDMDGM
jgi:hypothetical protein